MFSREYCKNHLVGSDGGFLCEDGWILYRDQCYLLSDYSTNWYAARRDCQDFGLGADLAQVRVQEVDAFLIGKLPFFNYYSVHSASYFGKFVQFLNF